MSAAARTPTTCELIDWVQPDLTLFVAGDSKARAIVNEILARLRSHDALVEALERLSILLLRDSPDGGLGEYSRLEAAQVVRDARRAAKGAE